MSESVVEEFAAAWSSHDPERLARIFTEDCIYEDVVLDVCAQGHEDVKTFLRDWLASSSDLRMELKKLFGGGGAMGAEWLFSGTLNGELEGIPATGKRFEFRGASHFEFENGKIKACIDFWDMATLRRQSAVGGFDARAVEEAPKTTK